MFSWNSLRGALLYFLWSCLQQLTLQSMIYLPLRTALPPIKAAFFTGLIFAVVHAPNPVLVVGTLIWGMAAPLLFERWRSIWALGLAQVALSSLLLQLTPYRLNHGFRIGPFY
jgi:membrane protease YdiL (CAAX protease family)